MVDVREMLVQFCSQPLRLLFLEELRPGPDAPVTLDFQWMA